MMSQPARTKQMYWNPFGASGDITVETNGKYYLSKPNCTEVFMLNEGFLSTIPNDVLLLIDGHSNGLPKISADTKGAYSSQYDVVAGWIRYGQLPAGHLVIKLVGCETWFCAQMLAAELGKDHPNIVVGGYTHKVVHGAGNRSLIVKGTYDMVRNSTGSGYVKWYDAKGKQIQKPAMTKYDF